MSIVKCSNSYICEVDSTILNGKKVVQIDFIINSYQILLKGRGWTEVIYPQEVLPSIKDKLYLAKDSLYNTIVTLDTFIETGDIVLSNTTQTSHGFSIMSLKDELKNEISIQKSSAATDDYIWFGVKINQADIGEKKDGHFIRYQYDPNNSGIIVTSRLHLGVENAQKLRLSILTEMAKNMNSHDIADLVDKDTIHANNMIMDIWGDLSRDIQRINFGYACGKGNLDLVKKIYEHPENKFTQDFYTNFEEYGITCSMQPESKKVLKFFKECMKEKELDLSNSMEKWIRDNRLGRKIKIK